MWGELDFASRTVQFGLKNFSVIFQLFLSVVIGALLFLVAIDIPPGSPVSLWTREHGKQTTGLVLTPMPVISGSAATFEGS